jgi:3-oxoacyl-[acyl-carrier protein] reductase
MGGVTGGLGQPLHQALCGIYAGTQVVSAIGRRHCDVESEASIRLFFETIVCDGPLHVINATGVSISGMIHKTEVSDINRMLRVNLVSNILMLKYAREIYKAHGGTFTMFSSVTASDGPAGTAVYSASKAALNGLTRVASKEFAGWGTRVNCLELGYFNRGMISQLPGQHLQTIVDKIPLQDLGTVGALAEACRFLIECEYLTGATVKVNGGL